MYWKTNSETKLHEKLSTTLMDIRKQNIERLCKNFKKFLQVETP